MINEFQKYPSDKEKFDRNYLRVFGKVCPFCRGTGWNDSKSSIKESCVECKGLGYIEK